MMLEIKWMVMRQVRQVWLAGVVKEKVVKKVVVK